MAFLHRISYKVTNFPSIKHELQLIFTATTNHKTIWKFSKPTKYQIKTMPTKRDIVPTNLTAISSKFEFHRNGGGIYTFSETKIMNI